MCTTVNVDNFTCINCRGFMKMGNLTCIKICVLSIIGSLGYYKSNFRGVHIFADIKEMQIAQKYVQRKNIYIHSMLPNLYSLLMSVFIIKVLFLAPARCKYFILTGRAIILRTHLFMHVCVYAYIHSMGRMCAHTS